jgi:FkbM family methyltransferase
MTSVEQIINGPSKSTLSSFVKEVNGKKIIIYGQGAGYHSFNQFVLKRYGLTPSMFIDEKYVNEDSEIKLSEEKFFEKFPADLSQGFYILVTIGDLNIFDAIKERFIKHGWDNVHSTLDVYEYNLCYAPIGFENNLLQIYEANCNSIDRAYSLLSDEKSRNIFLGILEGHWNRRPILFQDYSPDTQYIVDGIGLSETNISLLDCGAYDGDTLLQFSAKYGNINLAVALECDLKNYEKLVKKTYPKIDKLIALPVGSADKSGQLYFVDDNKMQSRLSQKIENQEGRITVSVINCDEVFRGIGFTKIVIDTEGYEKQSLIGMKQIISSLSPDITVAAYHYPTDFYEILNLIHLINPDYKFYLRNHSPFVAETVLYAVKN